VRSVEALYDGSPVYHTSAVLGQRPKVGKAQAGNPDKRAVFGIATQPFSSNQDGFITIFGIVRDIDNAVKNGQVWSPGERLWLSTTAGCLTNQEPVAPENKVECGMVLETTGQTTIFCSIVRSLRLYSLDDVNGDAPTTTGQVLQWNNDLGYWEAGTNVVQLSTDFNTHLGATLPHRFVDGGTTYAYGLALVGGEVVMTYEEV